MWWQNWIHFAFACFEVHESGWEFYGLVRLILITSNFVVLVNRLFSSSLEWKFLCISHPNNSDAPKSSLSLPRYCTSQRCQRDWNEIDRTGTFHVWHCWYIWFYSWSWIHWVVSSIVRFVWVWFSPHFHLKILRILCEICFENFQISWEIMKMLVLNFLNIELLNWKTHVYVKTKQSLYSWS